MNLLSNEYYRGIYDGVLASMAHSYACVLACEGYPMFEGGRRYEQCKLQFSICTMPEGNVYSLIFLKLYDIAAMIADAKSLSLDSTLIQATARSGIAPSLGLPESDIYEDVLNFSIFTSRHHKEPSDHFWNCGLLHAYYTLAYMLNSHSDGKSANVDERILHKLYPVIRMYYRAAHSDAEATYQRICDSWQSDDPIPGRFKDIPSTWDPPFMQEKSTNGQQSGGCYVATAVYGSYDCPQVWTLRRYRDYDLAETWYGRAFIKVYYATSPTLVRWFGNAEWFKRMWRGRLDNLVRRCLAKGYEGSPYEDRIW